MTIETCLTIMVITQLLVIAFLVFLFFLTRNSVKTLSAQVQQLLVNLNMFVDSNLHLVSSAFADLLTKTAGFVSDAKQGPVDRVLKSLSALNSGNSSEEESESKKNSISEIFKWVSRGLILFKLTRRLVKNHGK